MSFDIVIESPEWMKQARCRDVADPDIFFPERGGNTTEARALCAECSVMAECLELALGDPDCNTFGIFGGTYRGSVTRLSGNVPWSLGPTLRQVVP